MIINYSKVLLTNYIRTYTIDDIIFVLLIQYTKILNENVNKFRNIIFFIRGKIRISLWIETTRYHFFLRFTHVDTPKYLYMYSDLYMS